MAYAFIITGMDPSTGRVVEMEVMAETVVEAMRRAKEMGLRYVAVRRASQEVLDSTPPIEAGPELAGPSPQHPAENGAGEGLEDASDPPA